MTEPGSLGRTLPWRIVAALAVAGLLAVGSWVFDQDGPDAPPTTETGALRNP